MICCRCSKRQKKAIIPWTHLVDIASESAIVDKEEVQNSSLNANVLIFQW